MLRFDRKQQNSVKQLSFNKKANYLKKNVFYATCCVGTCTWLTMVIDLELQFSANLEKTHLCWRNIWQSVCFRSTIHSWSMQVASPALTVVSPRFPRTGRNTFAQTPLEGVLTDLQLDEAGPRHSVLPVFL